jgi:hypothetical protein
MVGCSNAPQASLMWWLILVTGTLPQNIAHNLGVIPELMIVKRRNLGEKLGYL